METKFVQVGLKKNGRIKKNEQFTIPKFITRMFNLSDIKPKNRSTKLSFWDRLDSEKVEMEIRCARASGIHAGYNAAMEDFKMNVADVIEEDNFGKKRM